MPGQSLFTTILFGALQGISEFLPISSSGHLLVLHQVLGNAQNSLALDAVLHLATALALLIYFRQDWLAMLTNWRKDPRLRWLIIGSTPAAIAGWLGEDFISVFLRSAWVVVFMLVAISGLMLLTEAFFRPSSNQNLTLRRALIIGLAQITALIPGTSRSGITIIAGMWQGLNRREAARFSFLLGTPITFGAGVLKLPTLMQQTPHLAPIGISFFTAVLVGLASIHWLLGYLEKSSLKIFAFYRIALALGVSLFLI